MKRREFFKVAGAATGVAAARQLNPGNNRGPDPDDMISPVSRERTRQKGQKS